VWATGRPWAPQGGSAVDGIGNDVRVPLLAVVGAHLHGEPLNHQLTDRGAQLVRTTRTAPSYRLYSLPTEPPKPGLVRTVDRAHRDPEAGAIEVEVWELDDAALGSFLTEVAAPLCLGTLELDDGTTVLGFLCEELATRGCADITSAGGWRAARGSNPPG
jgi:allophanate hydrolase